MSLFGTSTTVTFGSLVYNLAGPEAHRPQYLKTVIAGAVLQSAPITETIRNSYLSGPRTSFRSFTNWARNSGFSDAISQTGSSLTLVQSVDTDTLLTLMPSLVTVGAGQTTVIQSCSIGLADFTHWADQYVARNHPTDVGTGYTAEFDQVANVITVTFADTSTASFTPSGYDKGGQYLYVAYVLTSGSSMGSIVTGSTISGAMPSTTGWTSDSSSDPSVTVWERTTYEGLSGGGSSTTSLREIMYQNATAGTYRIDTQTITDKTISPIDVLIYEKGSGYSSVDALFHVKTDNGDFFPFVPIRINKQFVSPDYLAPIYVGAKKALKKTINGKLDKIISDIGANSSIDKIFNAYVVFGVSLNVVENSCRKYVYKFFQHIMLGQDLSGSSYASWLAAWDAADALMSIWQAWSVAQSDPSSPLYGTDEPSKPTYPTAPTTSIQVGDGGSDTINYTSTISFSGVAETIGFGLLKPDAKPGELWFEVVDETITRPRMYSQFSEFAGAGIDTQHIRLNWQIDATHWRYLDVYGLTHTQQLFRDKTVIITGVEALGDSSESGFIIPLHQGVYNSMSVVDSTQMSTACAFLVFTTAVVTKTSFFESGLFKILLIVVIIIIVIVVAIIIGPETLAALPGLLGTAGSVGAAVGLTGVAAAIAGLAINAIAAIILSAIITKVATAILGPKLGPLVGAIIALAVTADITAFSSGVSLASMYSGLSLVTNLAKLTIAVADGISQYIQVSAQETLGKLQGVNAEYNKDTLEIQKQTDLLGSNNGLIDPLMFTDVPQIGSDQDTKTSVGSNSLVEQPELFLTRTLMTGSDLASLSMDMLTEFARVTLNTELPI